MVGSLAGPRPEWVLELVRPANVFFLVVNMVNIVNRIKRNTDGQSRAQLS